MRRVTGLRLTGRTFRALSLCGVGAAAILTATPALAQETSGSDVIIITAQKRARTSSMSVPR